MARKRFGDPDQPIIELHQVPDGIISNGSQENVAEAQALTDKLKDLLKHPAYREASFGVICLFEEQVRLVQDLVAEQDRPTADHFMALANGMLSAMLQRRYVVILARRR